MSYNGPTPFKSKEDTLESIRMSGRFIEAHAENILGEWPGLINGLDLSISLEFGSVPILTVHRRHIVDDDERYPLAVEISRTAQP